MKLPGYFAEAALATAAARRAGMLEPAGVGRGIVPQQEFPPGHDRPVVPNCDHGSFYEEQCAPCTLRRVPSWPPTTTGGFVWRESVRRCITCYDHNGQPYPFCGPCFERACSPFVALDRASGIGFA